jgi:hypothetical protein
MQVVSRRFIVKSRVQSQVSLCGICDGQSGTVTGFSPSTSACLPVIPPLLRTYLFSYHRRHAVSVLEGVLK